MKLQKYFRLYYQMLINLNNIALKAVIYEL